MQIRFSKYKKYGGYHFKWYNRNGAYKEHVDNVAEWIKGKDVLDIGAGEGLLVSLTGITGIDNEPYAIKAAKKRGVDIILGDAYKLPFVDRQFESAFMGDVLEHFEFPELALKEASRVIKEYLYIVAPLPQKIVESFHYNNWNQEELIELIENNGFKLEGKAEVKFKKIYAKFKKII